MEERPRYRLLLRREMMKYGLQHDVLYDLHAYRQQLRQMRTFTCIK